MPSVICIQFSNYNHLGKYNVYCIDILYILSYPWIEKLVSYTTISNLQISIIDHIGTYFPNIKILLNTNFPKFWDKKSMAILIDKVKPFSLSDETWKTFQNRSETLWVHHNRHIKTTNKTIGIFFLKYI